MGPNIPPAADPRSGATVEIDAPRLLDGLVTRRLILRPTTLADAEATQRLFPHWEIVRFLASSVPWPYPADGAIAYYRDVVLPAMAKGEGWYWSIFLKQDPATMIGHIALVGNGEDSRGFWIGRAWQGRGFASEASSVVTDFWFDVLGRSVLRVSKAAANTASRRITEREGMRLVAHEEREFVSGRLPAETWEMTADEWRGRRAFAEEQAGGTPGQRSAEAGD